MTARHSILLLDDDPKLGQKLLQKLKKEGYEVHFVCEMTQALDYLKHHEAPTFILADRVLDDPIEVRYLGWLSQHSPMSKILVYTTEPLSDEQQYTIIEKGAFRVLDKNKVDQLVKDIKVLTQELDQLLELSDELTRATAERSKIMAALIGTNVAVSIVDRQFHSLFRNSVQEDFEGGICHNHCWTASFVPPSAPPKCWGCTVADVFRLRAAVDGLFLSRFPDNSVRWVAVRSTPVFSRSNESVIAACEAVTEVSETALAGLPLEQRLQHIAQSLVRAGFGRARLYRAISEEKFKLSAAASRSDNPQSPKSEYFEKIRDFPVTLDDCPYAQRAIKERIGNLVCEWGAQGPSPLMKTLGLELPYFDVPVWRDDEFLEGWISLDFASMEQDLRDKAVAQYATIETVAWLHEQYGREVKRALEAHGGKPEHREKLEIAQRAHLGIASARSVQEAIKELQTAFEKLLPNCRISVRKCTPEGLREFESLCWGGPLTAAPANISFSNQDSLAVLVVKTHLPRFISDYERYVEDAKKKGDAAGCVPKGTRSTAEIPLRFEDTVFGTLSVNSPSPIEWNKNGYEEPLMALAKDTALVLRDLALQQQLDEAMSDRAAIIAYSVSVSADGLWRHWAQQRLAEASAIAARIRVLLANQQPPSNEEVKQLLFNLSTVITRVHSARPIEDAPPECVLSTVFSRLGAMYADRNPVPSFTSANNIPPLAIPEFVLLNVLMVLIDNALRALQDSSKGSTIAVEPRWENGFIEISVADDGPGIPEDQRERILRQPLQSIKGQGLGLLYARGAALQYGGNLTFKTSNAGTQFIVRLPLGQRQGAAAAK